MGQMLLLRKRYRLFYRFLYVSRCVWAFVAFWVALLALIRVLLSYEFPEHNSQRDASSGKAGKVESSEGVPVSAETQHFSGLPEVYRCDKDIRNTPAEQVSVKLIRTIDSNPTPIYFCKHQLDQMFLGLVSTSYLTTAL